MLGGGERVDLPKVERLCFGAGACAGIQNLFEAGGNKTELRSG